MRALLFVVAVLSIFGMSVVSTADNIGVTVKTPGGPDIQIQKGPAPAPAPSYPVVVQPPVVVERTTVVEKPSSCSCRAAKN